MDIHALKLALQQGVVTILFTKMNGEKRQMYATLQDSVVPPLKEGLVHHNNPDVLTVYDTEAQGWRSMRVELISKWEAGQVAPAPAPAPETIGWSPKTVPTPIPSSSDEK